MGNIIFYANGGSANHGCEALVRSTIKVLGINKVTSFSSNSDEDNKYGLSEYGDFHCFFEYQSHYSLRHIIAKIYKTLFKSQKLYFAAFTKKVKLLSSDSIALSVGGDNYSYGMSDWLYYLHNSFISHGIKTVLWGCSINSEVIDERLKEDLEKYYLITVRESITYKALLKANISTEIKMYPDSAFILDKIDLPLPKGFVDGNTIGINVSPMIINHESVKGATMINYKALIKHIIDTTDCQIALIPHVVWSDNDDREPLDELYSEFKSTGRVVKIDDHNCMELKGFISRCRMFIGARTHATIAAYSTNVPTLAIGYSVKAKGIAKDIFGTYENYVIPVQSLENKESLINAFEWLKEKEDSIRKHLQNFMPGYCAMAYQARIEIDKIIGVSIEG